ncbi:MAG TPA: peptide-methionine (S)-S-oxide reductase MsrA [Spongiibacteraceae bacterium]|nr:peptide-methionine (S)-S-oxide reductase MsrA [Spongiibacteraceae bacterium]
MSLLHVAHRLKIVARLKPALVVLSLLGIGFGLLPTLHAAESAVVLPAALVDNPKAPGELQTAVLAGGCFWGVQGVFEHVKGVHKVLAGYAGGTKASATYETVSSGGTGHAEAVQISFDPQAISYGEILRIYFSVAHDPTQLNRQGPDTGTQYRSAIFYTDDAQKNIAQAYVAQLDKTKLLQGSIVTRIDPLKGFYAAEDYHQDFLIKNPRHPYIVFNDLPKIKNLNQVYPDYYRAQPVTVDAAH